MRIEVQKQPLQVGSTVEAFRRTPVREECVQDRPYKQRDADPYKTFPEKCGRVILQREEQIARRQDKERDSGPQRGIQESDPGGVRGIADECTASPEIERLYAITRITMKQAMKRR